jgi:hypothetical protein
MTRTLAGPRPHRDSDPQSAHPCAEKTGPPCTTLSSSRSTAYFNCPPSTLALFVRAHTDMRTRTRDPVTVVHTHSRARPRILRPPPTPSHAAGTQSGPARRSPAPRPPALPRPTRSCLPAALHQHLRQGRQRHFRPPGIPRDGPAPAGQSPQGSSSCQRHQQLPSPPARIAPPAARRGRQRRWRGGAWRVEATVHRVTGPRRGVARRGGIGPAARAAADQGRKARKSRKTQMANQTVWHGKHGGT